MARPGWSLTSYDTECDLKHGARATTPSAPSKVASQHLLDGAATPPLRGGEHPFLQFIHTFLPVGFIRMPSATLGECERLLNNASSSSAGCCAASPNALLPASRRRIAVQGPAKGLPCSSLSSADNIANA